MRCKNCQYYQRIEYFKHNLSNLVQIFKKNQSKNLMKLFNSRIIYSFLDIFDDANNCFIN